MRRRRKFLIAGLIVVAAVVVTAVVLYGRASVVPKRYRPSRLSDQRRRAVVIEFAKEIETLHNKVALREAYILTFTEERLNEYLASMDEIASGLPGGVRPGHVKAIMDRAGLADPAVAVRDGKVTLMVQSTSYGKVLSIDLAFSLVTPEQIAVRLTGSRVGRLPLPRGAAERILARLQRALRRANGGRGVAAGGDGPGGSSVGFSSEDVGAALAAVILAIDTGPIPTEHRINRKQVRVVGIEANDGRLSVRLEPVGKKRSARDAGVNRDRWPEGFR